MFSVEAGRQPPCAPVGPQHTAVRHARDPLTLALSKDGVSFDRAFALRWGAPERRFPGSHKDYGYAYPGAYVDGGTLWVVCESEPHPLCPPLPESILAGG